MECDRKSDPSCCVDDALLVLEVQSEYYPILKYPLHICTMILDLRFFKMFFWGLEYGEESLREDEDLHCDLRCMTLILRSKAIFFRSLLLTMKMNAVARPDYRELSDEEETIGDVNADERAVLLKVITQRYREMTNGDVITDWGELSGGLENTIQEYKEKINEICILALRGVFECKSCQSRGLFLDYTEHTVSFIDLILENLQDLESMINLTAPVKEQTAYIKKKLRMFGKFAYVAQHSPTATSRECLSHTHTWANHISYLACLYWINGVDESLASSPSIALSDLMQEHMPYTPSVISLYLDICTSKIFHKFKGDKGILQLPVRDYVDFLFEHLILHATDYTEILESLRHGLMLLLSFAVDPPEEDSEEKELILASVHDIISEVPSIISIPEANLSSFLHKIDEVSVLIRELCVSASISLELNSPQTNAMGFVDSLLRSLKNMLKGKIEIIPCMREYIKRVEEELISLHALLEVNLELESEHGDLWVQIVNLAYFVAQVTKLCSTTCFPVWYGIVYLPKLVEDINVVKHEVIKRTGDGQIQMLSQKLRTIEIAKSSKALQVQATTSNYEGTCIGFEEDAQEISNRLLRGQKGLAIISISGMAGLGKTTLAKRIFNDLSVGLHFHHKVWCYVSKECTPRELLMNICGCNVDANLEEQDFIEAVWRSLKGLRYLIVLDDIWDVEVWRQVERVFPDNKNGSRILFTSRNHDLASEADPNSCSYHLRLFSDKESWELMKAKLSMCGSLPEAFLEIAERIAMYCQGLPLAISLIASYLNTIAQVEELWEQVADNLKSHLSTEGCMHVVELSYKYLPEHLKPCFLYLGTFPRKRDIRAKELKLLWIAEGFVKDNEMQFATEYLYYLVSRNLVVVTQGSSTGGIKECRVHHDLIYDLCLKQAVRDNFLRVADESFAFGTKSHDFHHRLWLDGWYPCFTLPKSTSARGGLPPHQIHTLMHYSFPTYRRNSLTYFLRNFRVLTVLVLKLGSRLFPKVILLNIHLRYLGLTISSIVDIPAPIIDLWNLETLVVKSNNGTRIPDTLWGMESLKYAYIEKFRFNRKGMWPHMFPMSTGATCNIEVLKGIILKYDLETEDFLRRLVRLRRMRCRCDEKEVIHPMWFTMFGSLENLESLHLSYIALRNGYPVFQKLPALNFPCNLKKLVLFRFGLPWSSMSTIGKLSNLRVLKLLFSACIGSTWHLRDGEFSKLIYLKLDFMDVVRIDDSDCDDPFPCLRGLIVQRCTKLKEIPSSFGDICTLEVIDITKSPRVADSVKRIAEQQREMGNDSFQVFGLKDEVFTEETVKLILLKEQENIHFYP